LLKKAQLKDRTAVMEGIDYRSRSGLDRPQLASLTTSAAALAGGSDDELRR
jgi:hypothetical protein